MSSSARRAVSSSRYSHCCCRALRANGYKKPSVSWVRTTTYVTFVSIYRRTCTVLHFFFFLCSSVVVRGQLLQERGFDSESGGSITFAGVFDRGYDVGGGGVIRVGFFSQWIGATPTSDPSLFLYDLQLLVLHSVCHIYEDLHRMISYKNVSPSFLLRYRVTAAFCSVLSAKKGPRSQATLFGPRNGRIGSVFL